MSDTWVLDQAQSLYRRFRNQSPEKCEQWSDDAVEILKKYPRDIIETACSATAGIATLENDGFVVNTFQLRAFCEKLHAPILRARQYEEERRKEALRAVERAKPNPPLSPKMQAWLDEMREKARVPQGDDETAARRRALIEKADARRLVRECQEAGMPIDSPVSPSLANIVAAWKAERESQ